MNCCSLCFGGEGGGGGGSISFLDKFKDKGPADIRHRFLDPINRL